jgi:hypothetical protein
MRWSIRLENGRAGISPDLSGGGDWLFGCLAQITLPNELGMSDFEITSPPFFGGEHTIS